MKKKNSNTSKVIKLDEKDVKKLAAETAEEIFDIEGERLFTFKLYYKGQCK